jgi:hypothetical protein
MREFLSPVGRLVQGDCFNGNDKDQKGVPLTIKTGPNKGQPTKKYFQAIAFPKNDPAIMAQFGELYGNLTAEGKAGYPQFFDAQGNCTHPRFALKVVDGDGIDQDGQPNNKKEGFAGHWILKCSSTYPPRCFADGKYDPSQVLTPDQSSRIKRGYFVRVAGTIAPNTGSEVPGVYVNANMVELIGYGPEITSGPQAQAVFGAAPVAAMPAGMSSTPMAPPGATGQPSFAPGGGGMGAAPGGMAMSVPGGAYTPPAGQPSFAPGGMAISVPGGAYTPSAGQAMIYAPPGATGQPSFAPPSQPPMAAPGYAPPPQTPMAVAPNHQFVANAAAPAFTPPPAQQQQLVMTPQAGAYTYQQFIDGGYTVERMINEGYARLQ